MIGIDTDIIIDFFKGNKKAVCFIKENIDNIFTTSINEFEIYSGIYRNGNKKELEQAKEFFKEIEILGFENCSEIAAKMSTNLIQKGMTISQNDYFIASVIIGHGHSSILTGNKKHFSRIPGIKVIDY